MNETFRLHVEALHPACERLLASTPFKFADLGGQRIPHRGVQTEPVAAGEGASQAGS